MVILEESLEVHGSNTAFASGFNPEGMSYLDGTGASTWGWTTTFGLTLANPAVPAVISYIGYEADGSDAYPSFKYFNTDSSFTIGGNWNKSPTTTIGIPPKGKLFLRAF